MGKDRHNLERLLQSAYDFQRRQETINMEHLPKDMHAKGGLLWYESSLFWGCISLAGAIVLAVIAAMLRDFRWLLIFAFPLAVIAWLVACHRLKSRKVYWTVFSLLVIATGGGLLKLNQALAPKSEPTLDAAELVRRSADNIFHATATNNGRDVEHVGLVYEYFVAERQDERIKFYRLYLSTAPVLDVPFKRNLAMDMHLSFTDNFVDAYQKTLTKNRASILGVKITMKFRMYGETEGFRKVWVYNALGRTPGEPPMTLMLSTIDKAGPSETQKDFLSSSEVMPFVDAADSWEDYIYTYEMKKGAPISIPLPTL